MTVLTKAVFSVALLACGFGLASLFGPPELADGFANALRPSDPKPGWGALQPLDQEASRAPAWQEYETAAFHQPAHTNPHGAPSQLAATPNKPASDHASYSSPAPLWSPDGAAPIASWRAAKPVATDVAAQASRQDYGVAAAAWREPTAPVGWPVRESPLGEMAPASAPLPPAAPPVAPPPSGKPFAPLPASPADAQSANPPQTPTILPQQPAPQPAPRSEWSPWGATAPAPVQPTSSWPTTPVSPVATSTPQITPVVEQQASAAPTRHIVTDGDTLHRIAERYLKDPQRAGEIFLANQATLTNPNLLPIGAELVIPNATAAQGISTNAPAPTAPRAQLLMPRSTPAAGLAQW